MERGKPRDFRGKWGDFGVLLDQQCRKTAVSGAKTGSLDNWVWVNQELRRWSSGCGNPRFPGKGNGFGGGETAGRERLELCSGRDWRGFEMRGHPSPLQTKGEGFCFWQDQELKLKKRAQHQTRRGKRKLRNTKDLTPLFFSLLSCGAARTMLEPPVKRNGVGCAGIVLEIYSYKQEKNRAKLDFQMGEDAQAQMQRAATPSLLSPNTLQVFSMPLNAVHHDEGEVAFIALQELLLAAAAAHHQLFYLFWTLFLLLPLTLDWSNKVQIGRAHV